MTTPLVRALALIALGLAVLLCTACGAGDTGDDGSVDDGFDNSTFKRYANGRYTLQSTSGELDLHYWRYDGDDKEYKQYVVTITAPAVDVLGQAVHPVGYGLVPPELDGLHRDLDDHRRLQLPGAVDDGAGGVVVDHVEGRDPVAFPLGGLQHRFHVHQGHGRSSTDRSVRCGHWA